MGINARPPARSSNRKSVLVVDDDALLRAQIALYLGSQDITCLEAEDGASALEVLAEQRPDVVLLDIMMPDMSGIDVARRIAEFEPQPKVILVSGYDDALREANRATLDVFAVVSKPIPLKVIAQFLHRAFGDLPSAAASARPMAAPLASLTQPRAAIEPH